MRFDVEGRDFSPEERERLCRLALEPHGLVVKRFWIDANDLGHAECEDIKGRVFMFKQKAKQQ